ncbi:hypothetical protein [Capillimicrobium parvum]|uniref:Uncharacterized protein n=1 Tax=Capillimicrobium parvum TaxID=2884022 RepID=A0A9E6Y3R5_9ACTN|nr:hypothetical protein [Capillimicrobium parvum]UGS38811.1 hypothetical protein DSM104329_05241 [Capillimicrobium parvum]
MAPKHSVLATIAALASIGAIITGCGGNSGSDTSASTGATSTPASTPSTSTPSTTPAETTPGQTSTTPKPPKDLPLRKNTKITETQLTAVRDRMKLFAQCVRDTGSTVSTEPKDVKGFGLRRAQGGLLRVTWKGGSDGADVVVLATLPNAKRTKASLTEQPKVVRKKMIVIAFDSKPTAAQTKTINACTTRANK